MKNNDLDYYKEFGVSILERWTPTIATLIFQITQIDPIWNSFVGIITASVLTYKDLTESRGKELLQYIKDNADDFKSEIIETDNFKATFANIWETYLRENSESKRKRLRKYLLNLGKGASINEHYYDKIHAVISDMSDLEAEIFGKIYDLSEQYIPKDHMQFEMKAKIAGYSDDDLLDAAHSLHSYRLINISLPQIGFVNIRAVTKFGEVFYATVIK